MSKILIVDRVLPMFSEQLTLNGFDCTTDMELTYDSFSALPDEYEGLIIRSRFVVDKKLIDAKRNLRFIVRIGSGMENIDVDYARTKNIECISTPEGNANAVAELCLSFLMSAMRHLNTADSEVRQGEWLREKNKGSELASRTVGIIGYGHTGPAFARILHLLGCKVLCYDRYKSSYGDENATPASLDEICKTCDVISLHVNYLPENHHFINEDFIHEVVHPFIFINSSRGAAVDTASVINGINDGKITCACFDVLEFESSRLKIPQKEEWPLTLQELAKMDKVILTPHIGGQTFESEQRHAEIAVKRILQL